MKKNSERNGIPYMQYIWQSRRALLLFPMLIGFSAAHAFDPTTELGRVEGLTDLQQRAGDAVQRVCGGFINENIDQSRDDVALQGQLFDKCGEMVHTARVLAGEETGTDRTAKSLGISAEQLGAALQNIAGEEIAAAGSLATESSTQQASVVGNRLAGVLSRMSTLQVSSLNLRGPRGLVLAEGDQAKKLYAGGAAGDADGLSSALGFYLSGIGASTKKSETEGEDAFDSNASGISLGFDKQFTTGFMAGLNLSYATTDGDYRTTESVAGGDLQSDQTNLSLYGMWFSDSTYVDLVAGFGAGNYDMERRIVITSAPGAEDARDPANPQANDGANDTVGANTGSTVFRLGVSGGLELNSGAITFAPYSKLSYLSVDLDGYEETGVSALRLRVNSQTIESLTAGFGFRIVGTYSGSKAVISPQFSMELVHEFMDDSRQIVSTYVHDPRNLPLIVVTDSPDRTYYSSGFGISAVLPSGTQLYSEVRSLMDLDTINDITFTAGVRFAF